MTSTSRIAGGARLYRGLIALIMSIALATSLVEAAGIGVAVQQVDASQFPQVRINASVADSEGVPITGLDDQAFKLTEDGKPITKFQVQPIVNSQEPVAVVFIMDVSGSMNDNGKLAAAKDAASAYVDTMGPNDSAALISFSDTVTIDQGYTSDQATLKKAINALKANGNTAIYDAVVQAAILQGAIPQRRKIMLLMTDGDDNRSKNSLDDAINAAKKSGAPVFAVGLGSDVKKDALTKLATSTGGQAIFVSKGTDLKQIFLSIGDQLRREYVIDYTSALPADSKTHTVEVTATYRGQTAKGTGTFVQPKTPLALDVSGITDGAKVSGVQKITVTAKTGTIAQAELLVDGKSVSTAKAAPFTFQWDPSQESPGIHTVIVRATDASGASTDAKFDVEVVGAATPAASPTTVAAAAVAPVTLSPTVVATPAPAKQAATNPLYYVAGGLAALILIVGGLIAFLVTRRPGAAAAPAPPPPPAPPREQTVVTDRTEVIAPPPPPIDATMAASDGNATVVGGMPSAPSLPRGKLVIVQNGTKTELPVRQAEVILGREASNPVVIKDPLASRRHAKIVIDNGEFWVEDLKSLNGTRVNGEVITRRKLANNDQIKIGDATVTFVAE